MDFKKNIDSTVKLLFDKVSFDSILKEIKKPATLGSEVEVRIGYKSTDGKYHSGFFGDGKSQMWYKLLTTIYKSGMYSNPIKKKTLTENIGSFRKTISLQDDSQCEFIDKKRDYVNEILKVENYIFRLGISKEEPIDEKTWDEKRDKSSDVYKRYRQRVSFISNDASHRIDLTVVSLINGAKVSDVYEAEIEFLKAVDLTFEEFIFPLKIFTTVLHTVKTEKVPQIGISETHLKDIYVSLNKMLDENYKGDKFAFNKRAIPQPTNLKESLVKDLVSYSVTNKLNGTRYLLFSTDKDIYLVNTRQVLYLGKTGYTFASTLLDVEYFEGKCYIFDILFNKGLDVRNYPLPMRLAELSKIKFPSEINDNIRIKTFNMSGDIYKDTLKTIESMKAMKVSDNDGLIYTPIDLPYKNDKTYKWKPPRELTIDFSVNKISQKDNRYTYKLQVYNKDNALIDFRGSEKNPLQSQYYSTERNLEDKSVHEFSYIGDAFVYSRPREDKDMPNFVFIAQSVWDDIKNPLPEERLLELLSKYSQETKPNVRSFHNSIKRILISQYCKNATILDIGCGRGGDLDKYERAEIKKLVGIDPSADNLKEFHERLSKKANFRPKVRTINGSGLDTGLFKGIAKSEGMVDVVSMFFSLSFFGDTLFSLNTLASNIDTCLKRDGYFIGATIDGGRVFNTLKNIEYDEKFSISDDSYIKKLYIRDPGVSTAGVGLKVEFNLGEGTMVQQQREYLVPFEELTKILETKGIVLVYSKFFDPPMYIKDGERVFSQMNRSFVFQKKIIDREIVGISPLSPGKIEEYKTPLYLDIYRNGIPMTPSSLFECILIAESKKQYDIVPEMARTKVLLTMRNEISTKVTMEWWKSFGKGLYSRKISFDNILIEGITILLKPVNPILRQSLIDNLTILLTGKWKDIGIVELQSEYQSYMTDYLKENELINDKIKGLLLSIYSTAVERSRKLFSDNINSATYNIDINYIPAICSLMNKNIFVINSETGRQKAPKLMKDCSYIDKERTDNVFVLIITNHYELLSSKVDNKEVFNFDIKDDIVIKSLEDMGCK